MGFFKEQLIEQNDRALQDIQSLQRWFHDDSDARDSYSLFLPNYEKEVGPLLPHEKDLIPAQVVLESLKT